MYKLEWQLSELDCKSKFLGTYFSFYLMYRLFIDECENVLVDNIKSFHLSSVVLIIIYWFHVLFGYRALLTSSSCCRCQIWVRTFVHDFGVFFGFLTMGQSYGHGQHDENLPETRTIQYILSVETRIRNRPNGKAIVVIIIIFRIVGADTACHINACCMCTHFDEGIHVCCVTDSTWTDYTVVYNIGVVEPV